MNILSCGVFDLLHTGHLNYLHKIKNDNDKLIVLINSDRYVSTYKRKPIINEKDRLQMIQNIKCVDSAFIDDNEYLTDDILKKYKINKVIQAVDNPDIWTYYYHIPIQNNIMEFIEYGDKEISSTNIINKIRSNIVTDYNDRYTRENILKSEKLYGKGWQTICGNTILEKTIPNNKYTNILEIGCGLGGNCNYLAETFECSITGIDICKNMIDICNERNTNKNIQYILSDYKDYESDIKYDLILCRDVFLYLNTELLFLYLQKIKSQMSDGGIFVLIDYCQGENRTQEFTEYCMKREWNVIEVPFYKKLINDSGFKLIDNGSLSQYYIDYGKSKKNDVMVSNDVIDNLKLKLNYLNNKSFEWHFFILHL
jgi:cytidyltransferase-like protein